MTDEKMLSFVKHPCKICGLMPKVKGGYSSVFESIGYSLTCPRCGASFGASVSAYDLDGSNVDLVVQTHEEMQMKAVERWNDAMSCGGKSDG